MTETQHPQSDPTPLPKYDIADIGKVNISEKEHSCSKHSASQTANIDSALQQPGIRSAIRTLQTALDEALDSDRCTKCTIENATFALTRCLGDLKAAKKSGQWSKQDKKALKRELKGIGREMKPGLKDAWKQRSSK